MGECFFWYWLTGVVPDKGPLNGCVETEACKERGIEACCDELLCGLRPAIFYTVITNEAPVSLWWVIAQYKEAEECQECRCEDSADETREKTATD